MSVAPTQVRTGRVLDLDEEARLASLHGLHVLDTPPEERFDRVTRLAQRLFGVPVAAVTLLDRDRQWFKSTSGTDLTEVPRSVSFCDATLRAPEGLVVREDLSRDEDYRTNPLVTGEPALRFYAGHVLRGPGGQPIGTFCLLDSRPRSLSEAEREMLRDLAQYVSQELGLREEFSRAAQVQRALLPRTMPVLPGWEVVGTCLPARAVGGDLFDLYPVGDAVGLTVADVMGKGFAGAIMMASVRAVLRSAARSDTVAGAVAAAAEVLQEDLEETGTFVTLFSGRLYPPDGTLRWTDAGHGLTVVVRADGTTQRLTGSSLPLGVWATGDWEESETQLHPGDWLISISDGVLDLYDGTLSALDELAAVVREARSAQEVTDRIALRARRSELLDDVTALVVRRLPPGQDDGRQDDGRQDAEHDAAAPDRVVALPADPPGGDRPSTREE